MTSRAPYLHCIYTDDVRQEVSGKMMIIGMYTGDMQVSKLPATLPQLAIIATLNVPRDSDIPPESMRSLKLVLTYDDKELISIDAPVEVLPPAQGPLDADAVGFMVQMVVQVSPFAIEKESKLRTSVIINGTETLVGNSLKVKLNKGPIHRAEEVAR